VGPHARPPLLTTPCDLMWQVPPWAPHPRPPLLTTPCDLMWQMHDEDGGGGGVDGGVDGGDGRGEHGVGAGGGGRWADEEEAAAWEPGGAVMHGESARRSARLLALQVSSSL
jgi:hypothetical protein